MVAETWQHILLVALRDSFEYRYLRDFKIVKTYNQKFKMTSLTWREKSRDYVACNMIKVTRFIKILKNTTWRKLKSTFFMHPV